MTTGQQLLRGVLDDPQDDAVRLVYADFLEENGDLDRAEFIRVQCELASLVLYTRRTPGGLIAYEVRNEDADRYEALQARERELLALPLAPQSAVFAWSQPLHQTGLAIGKPWPNVFSFRRGFVDSVSCASRDFVRHAKVLFGAHPIERVKITDRIQVRFGASIGYDSLLVYRTHGGFGFHFNESGIWLDGDTLHGSAYSVDGAFEEATSEACVAFGHWMRDQPDLKLPGKYICEDCNVPLDLGPFSERRCLRCGSEFVRKARQSDRALFSATV